MLLCCCCCWLGISEYERRCMGNCAAPGPRGIIGFGTPYGMGMYVGRPWTSCCWWYCTGCPCCCCWEYWTGAEDWGSGDSYLTATEPYFCWGCSVLSLLCAGAGAVPTSVPPFEGVALPLMLEAFREWDLRVAFDNAGDLVFDALEFDRECDLRFAAREGEGVIVCSWFVLLESESWSSKSSSSSSSLPFESLPPLPFDEPSKSEGTFFSYGSSYSYF